MSPHESRLLPDGSVFPPVTPDPPAPPGQEEIVVPDVVIPSEGKREQEPKQAGNPKLEAEEDPPSAEPSA